AWLAIGSSFWLPRNRMRETFTSGSVGRAPGNRCLYPEPDCLQPSLLRRCGFRQQVSASVIHPVHYLTSAQRGQTPDTPSKMPPWAPWASFAPKRCRFWSTSRLQHTTSPNNVHTLLGVEQMPCDKQVRKRLDPLPPTGLDPVCVEVFKNREQPRLLAHVRVLGDQRLVALDGTIYFASTAIHGDNCLTRQLPNGQTRYDH